MKLTGVSYNWNKKEFPHMNFDDRRQIGFFAQEVEKIIPEAINKDEKGYYSLNYNMITPVLVEAIKAQQKMIEAKDEKIKELEERINKIEQMIQSNSKVSTTINPNSISGATLEQNIPNPSAGNTTIKYRIPQTAKNAALKIYSLNGALLQSFDIKEKGSGSKRVSGLTTGIYIYELSIDNRTVDSKKMEVL